MIYYGLKAAGVFFDAIDASAQVLGTRAFATLKLEYGTVVDEFGRTLALILGRDATGDYSHIFHLAQAYAKEMYGLYLVDTTNWSLPGNRLFVNLYTNRYVPRTGAGAHALGFDKCVDMRNVGDLDGYIQFHRMGIGSFDDFENEMAGVEYDEEQMAHDPLYVAGVAEDAVLYEEDVDEAVDASEKIAEAIDGEESEFEADDRC